MVRRWNCCLLTANPNSREREHKSADPQRTGYAAIDEFLAVPPYWRSSAGARDHSGHLGTEATCGVATTAGKDWPSGRSIVRHTGSQDSNPERSDRSKRYHVPQPGGGREHPQRCSEWLLRDRPGRAKSQLQRVVHTLQPGEKIATAGG